MTFSIDTSGFVPACSLPSFLPEMRWPDLNPFTQGYIEALFETIAPVRYRHRRQPGANGLCQACGKIEHRLKPWCFSDLAPEALARIMEDCAAVLRIIDSYTDPKLARYQGTEFWRARQKSAWSLLNQIVRFPPLTVYLGDDGKMLFE